MNYREEVLRNCPAFVTDTLEQKLSLAGLGLAGEAGEVVELLDGVSVLNIGTLHGKIIKELGDVRWYIEYLAAALDIELPPLESVEAKPSHLPVCMVAIAVHNSKIADQIKKVLHHGVPLESVKAGLIEKLTFSHRAVNYTAIAIGSSMDDIEETNVAKLRARHPNGWSKESQQAKADEVAQ